MKKKLEKRKPIPAVLCLKKKRREEKWIFFYFAFLLSLFFPFHWHDLDAKTILLLSSS